MPITIEYIEDGYITVVKFTDPWESSDMRPVMDADRAHRDAKLKEDPNAVIHLIVDMTETKTVAQGFLQARNSPSLGHRTAGKTFVATSSTMIRMVATTGSKIVGYKDMIFVETLDQAIERARAVLRPTS